MNPQRKIPGHYLVMFADIKKCCGPAPVLSCENIKAYDLMLLRLVESLEPRDFLERMLVKDVADASWEGIRLTRHKILLVERRHLQFLSHRAQRIKAAAPNNAVANAVHAAVKEAEAIVLQSPPSELELADALERGIEYAERLDKMLNAAMARRECALAQLERYRTVGFGKRRFIGAREITDCQVDDPGPTNKVPEGCGPCAVTAEMPEVDPLFDLEIKQVGTQPDSSGA
jgi:hypothetical protein